jgi:hypothetical protein
MDYIYYAFTMKDLKVVETLSASSSSFDVPHVQWRWRLRVLVICY